MVTDMQRYPIFASNVGFHVHMLFQRYVMSLEAISWLAVDVTTSQ